MYLQHKQVLLTAIVLASVVAIATGEGIDATFMEEVRNSLTNQWDVLQDIRLMIHNNKRGLVRVVKELKELRKSVEVQGEYCNKTTHLTTQYIADMQSSISHSAPTPAYPDYRPEDLHLLQEMTRVSQEMKRLTEAFDDLDQNNHISDSGTYPRSTIGNFNYSNIPDDGSCSLPFEEVGDTACIMVVTERLSWTQADNYCKDRNSRLAVVQGTSLKKLLNKRYGYGSSSSRVRWPFWIGLRWKNLEIFAKSPKDVWFQGLEITLENQGLHQRDLDWADGEPKRHKKIDAPEGICVIMDGYKHYQHSTLPCQYKRRFICQRY